MSRSSAGWASREQPAALPAQHRPLLRRPPLGKRHTEADKTAARQHGSGPAAAAAARGSMTGQDARTPLAEGGGELLALEGADVQVQHVGNQENEPAGDIKGGNTTGKAKREAGYGEGGRQRGATAAQQRRAAAREQAHRRQASAAGSGGGRPSLEAGAAAAVGVVGVHQLQGRRRQEAAGGSTLMRQTHAHASLANGHIAGANSRLRTAAAQASPSLHLHTKLGT